MVTSLLAVDEKKSPVQSIWFCGEGSVKTMKAVEECLALGYKSAPCRSLEK
jgi:hypothetical protein